MNFIADKQTLEDLNLLGKFKSNSIFSLFNKVKTIGGERLLDDMFKKPMLDADAINHRTELFKYFQAKKLNLPVDKTAFGIVENYLSNYAPSNVISATGITVWRKMAASFLRDERFNGIEAGLTATIDMLKKLSVFVKDIDIDFVQPAKSIFSDKRLQSLLNSNNEKLPLLTFAKFDHILRGSMRNEMEQLQQIVYQLDVYIAVSNVATEKKLHYAQALPANANIFESSALWHPGVDKAVANPVALNGSKNLIFLTGANMAGKSTLMKSFGVAVYLGHMGFPVAAKDMRFSVRDGLYSSINVSDDLNMGYSHFYAEVLRVKQVAETVASGKNMIVIFDELFKGTNVKDAYDATLSVTKAFSKYSNCCFIISTHIIEVGDALGETCDNITFSYLPTIMEGSVPRYTYRLAEGITNDRQGMMIIRNEGIVEMIHGGEVMAQ